MHHRLERLRGFFEELRRRRVYRVAAVYAVVSWVAVQIAATSLPYLMERPDWLVRAIIVVALVGFPAALVLGWIFDLTPQGVQRTDAQREEARGPGRAAERSAAGRRATPRIPILLFGVLSVSAVAVGFALWVVRARVGPGHRFRPSTEQVGRPTLNNGASGDGAGPGAIQSDTSRDRTARKADDGALTDSPHQRARPARPDTTAPAVHQGLEGAGRDTDDGPLPATPAAPRDVDSILRQIGSAVSGLQAGGIAQAEGLLPGHMRRTAVFPFRVTGINADAKWSDLVADSLSEALDEAGFTTVDPSTIRRALDQAGPDDGGRASTAKRARGFGADAFVTGVVVPQGASLVLEVMLSDVDKPDIIRHATAIVPTDRLNEALARLVVRLTTASDTTEP